MPNAQDEERAVCVCLNPFDVIAVALVRYLFIGALFHPGRCPRGTRGHQDHGPYLGERTKLLGTKKFIELAGC